MPLDSQFNFAGLSAWNQLNNRPLFVRMYKALGQIKSLMITADIYERYFAFNINQFHFGNFDKVKVDVLFGLQEVDQMSLYNDTQYGF